MPLEEGRLDIRIHNGSDETLCKLKWGNPSDEKTEFMDISLLEAEEAFFLRQAYIEITAEKQDTFIKIGFLCHYIQMSLMLVKEV